MARKPDKLSKKLLNTPSSGEDSDEVSMHHVRVLEAKISKLETRLNSVEMWKLSQQRFRATATKKRLEYKIRKAERGDSESQSDSKDPVFKRPRIGTMSRDRARPIQEPKPCPDMF